MKRLTLTPRAGFDPEFFAFESHLELMTSHPSGGTIQDLLSSFGPTDFLLKQSILPVVAWAEGESVIRSIGTAFVISCTGYLPSIHKIDCMRPLYGVTTASDFLMAYSWEF